MCQCIPIRTAYGCSTTRVWEKVSRKTLYTLYCNTGVVMPNPNRASMGTIQAHSM